MEGYLFRVTYADDCYRRWVWWRWRSYPCYQPVPRPDMGGPAYAIGDKFVIADRLDLYHASLMNDDLVNSGVTFEDFFNAIGTDSYIYHDSDEVCTDGPPDRSCNDWWGDGRSEDRDVYKTVPAGTPEAEIYHPAWTEQEIKDNIMSKIPYITKVDEYTYATGAYEPDGVPGPEFTKTGNAIRLDIHIRDTLGYDQPADLNTISLDDPDYGGFFDGIVGGITVCTSDCLLYEPLAKEELGIMDIYDVRYGLIKFEYYRNNDFHGNDWDTGKGGDLLSNLGEENETIQNVINSDQTDPSGGTPISHSLRDAYTYLYGDWWGDGIDGYNPSYNTNPSMYDHWVAEDWENSADQFNYNDHHGHIVQADPYYYFNCRRNYLILVTDGGEADEGGGGSMSSTLARMEKYVKALNEDPDGGGPKLGTKTYFIGFFIEYNADYVQQLEALADYSDWGPAWTEDMGNITDPFYAKDEAELKSSLASIMNIVLADTYTRSAPVVNANQSSLAAGYFEIAPFDYLWRGHFVGLQELTSEQWGGTIITATDDNPFIDAAELLNDLNGPNDHLKRDIFTALLKGNTLEKVDFIPSAPNSMDLSPSLDPDDIDGDTLTWQDGDWDDTELLIEFVRGKAGALFRDEMKTREWRLGAINRSSPKLVTEPGGPLVMESLTYKKFAEYHYDRPDIIYVGANDGMLHAFLFEDVDGDPDDTSRNFLEESFAYIPPSVHENLSYLWQGVQWYYVDGSPAAADVELHVDPSVIPADTTKAKNIGCDPDKETCWYTYLLCGLRQGGRSYFSLEITDADTTSSEDTSPEPAPWAQPKWMFDDPGYMGDSWSNPVVSEVHYKEPGLPLDYRVIAVFGGGWSESDEARIGSYLYIINVEDGQILKRFLIPDKTEDPGDSPYPDPDYFNTNNLPGDPAVVDRDKDGYGDIIYIGDIQGRVWKANILSSDTTEWKLSLFYDTADLDGKGPYYKTKDKDPKWDTYDSWRRPVFYRPTVVALEDSQDLIVYFGTGHIEESDEALNEESVNRVFAIIDSDTISGCSYGTLYHGDTTEWSGNWSTWSITSDERLHGCGFPIALQPGEKIMGPPVVIGGNLIFYTYSPVERPNVCENGSVFFWKVDHLSGWGILNVEGSTELQRVKQKAISATGCYTITPSGELITFNPPKPGELTRGGGPGVVFSASEKMGWGQDDYYTTKGGFILSWGEGVDFKL